MPEPGPSYTLVYDGSCGVCRRLVGIVERWDQRGRILAVTSEAAVADSRFPWISPAAYAEAIQFVGPDNRTWSGAQAVDQLLGVLPRGWLGRWVFRLPLASTLTDRWYRWFARHRHRLGCGDHCPAISPARPVPRSGTSAGSPRES